MLPELHANNAEVIGVSTDEHDTQCDFAASLAVSFPMVGDRSGEVSRLYDAARPLIKLNKRVTYVISPDLVIEAAFHHELAVGKHDQEVRAFLFERLERARRRAAGAGDADKG